MLVLLKLKFATVLKKPHGNARLLEMQKKLKRYNWGPTVIA